MKDPTSQVLSGAFDEDSDAPEVFNQRSKHRQKNKTAQTAEMRLGSGAELEKLPLGQVTQVHSLFVDIEFESRTIQCSVRKTLTKVREAGVIVGDLVRFVESASSDPKVPQAVIEGVLPRRTILTRSDSFKAIKGHPIVANADQVLIVASLREPTPKWGLIDRMVIAATSGGLVPILCLNKMDLSGPDDYSAAILAHYESLGVKTVQTSVERNEGIDAISKLLAGKSTVLAGHSGVGKSSLIRAIEPDLDIRIGAISSVNEKGMHTTSSARRYPLRIGGYVIDTPGVKLFGLWGMTAETLLEHFPDIVEDSAPQWRRESYERILESLA